MQKKLSVVIRTYRNRNSVPKSRVWPVWAFRNTKSPSLWGLVKKRSAVATEENSKESAIMANLQVTETLFSMAKSGKNTAAFIFWTKTRCGFRSGLPALYDTGAPTPAAQQQHHHHHNNKNNANAIQQQSCVASNKPTYCTTPPPPGSVVVLGPDGGHLE